MKDKGQEMAREAAPMWSAIANVKRQIAYGPAGAELKSGLRKFKAGAKVHVVGGYHGTALHVMVIGQHRHDGKYIRCVVSATALENLRVAMIYSPSVLNLLVERPDGLALHVERESAERFLLTLREWGAG